LIEGPRVDEREPVDRWVKVRLWHRRPSPRVRHSSHRLEGYETAVVFAQASGRGQKHPAPRLCRRIDSNADHSSIWKSVKNPIDGTDPLRLVIGSIRERGSHGMGTNVF